MSTVAHLLTRPCQVRNPVDAGVDEYGDPTYTYDTIATYCHAQPARGSEDLTQGQIARDDWLLFLPPDVTVTERTRVVIPDAGLTLEATEPPKPFMAPYASVNHHIELRAREVR